MENIIVRKVEEKDIPSIADIQVNGWKTAYRGIIDDAILNTMNKEDKIERFKSNYKKNGFAIEDFIEEIIYE